jgi:hypothetical protein
MKSLVETHLSTQKTRTERNCIGVEPLAACTQRKGDTIMKKAASFILASIIIAALVFPSYGQELPATGTIESRIGELSFGGRYPSDETIGKLYDEMDFQRAVQTYLWLFLWSALPSGKQSMRTCSAPKTEIWFTTSASKINSAC